MAKKVNIEETEFKELEGSLSELLINTDEMLSNQMTLIDHIPPTPTPKEKDTTKPSKKLRKKRTPKKPLGEFHELHDSATGLNCYDRFHADLNWISEAHSRAYESIQFAVTNLRRLERENNDLRAQLGLEKVFPDKVSFVDPPPDDEVSEMIPIHAKDVNRMAAVMFNWFIVFLVGLFVAIVAVIVK